MRKIELVALAVFILIYSSFFLPADPMTFWINAAFGLVCYGIGKAQVLFAKQKESEVVKQQ